MNAVIDVIKQRRSVRSYEDRPVPRELVETILDAGNWAPTGMNLQQWRFVVAQDDAFRARLLAAARPLYRKWLRGIGDTADEHMRLHLPDLVRRCLGWAVDSYESSVDWLLDKHDGVYYEAPVIIFVIGRASVECAMVCQNVMLAAQSLGLGSCIVAFGSMVGGDPEIVAALELQKDERIYGPVVIGYPAIVPEPPSKSPPVVKWI